MSRTPIARRLLVGRKPTPPVAPRSERMGRSALGLDMMRLVGESLACMGVEISIV